MNRLVSKWDDEVQSVLVFKKFVDPEQWTAVHWPEQRVMIGTARTREEAISSFVTAWNRRMKQDATEKDFRFFGPIKLTVELQSTDGGWQAWATAERMYLVSGKATMEEAKTAFIAHWNESHSDDEDVTDENVDWQVSE